MILLHLNYWSIARIKAVKYIPGKGENFFWTFSLGNADDTKP
jgi:hypothetical protein